MKVFADTGFFIAYYNHKDQFHHNAQQILKILKSQYQELEILLTDYVYDEALIALLKSHPKIGYKRAETFDRDVFIKRKVTFIFISESLFQSARTIFFRYNKDKIWSFTDCTSFALMKDYGLRDVLTFDSNFKEMGFRIVR
ncbi:type II toxin-antitoxin system VapC family toxin [Candidatus Gottesmanbacteria bacterium]|nr:type II toxin-antitoxin system VapC family toxin [Candidatus Gottesmanbacteria bacterium]